MIEDINADELFNGANPEKSDERPQIKNQAEGKPTGLKTVKDTFKKWLYLKDDNLIDVILGAVVANRLKSDPVWIFIVAPAGGTKTEVLRSLNTAEIFQVSSLSQHTLISGYTIKGKNKEKDPSLLRLLDGKVLVIKDFTCILSIDRKAREEILGTLRDAYDGIAKKSFGSEAMIRAYKAKFGLIAGVTPEIDRIYSVSQALGERFIKYRTPLEDRESIIRQASKNMGKENIMRDEIQKVVSDFLLNIDTTKEIETPEEIENKLIKLALLTALLRSDVSRNGYTRNVEFLPQAEVGGRLLKQLKGLAQGLALVRGESTITEGEYDLIAEIAKDTLTSKRLSLLIALVDKKEYLKTSIIAEEVRLHTNTVRETLDDYWLLGVVNRDGTETVGYSWKLEDRIIGMIQEAGI